MEGYRSHRNHSKAAMGWLTYIEKTQGVRLRHAWHTLGEKHLKDARVFADGYDEEKRVVYSFLGCLFHGHLDCLDNDFLKTTKCPKMNRSMGDLAMETKRWNKRVKQCGYKLVMIYECEWNHQIKSHPLIKEHVDRLGINDPITPRDALYGGRTEAICLHAVGDEDHPIKYIDVVSEHYTDLTYLNYFCITFFVLPAINTKYADCINLCIFVCRCLCTHMCVREWNILWDIQSVLLVHNCTTAT